MKEIGGYIELDKLRGTRQYSDSLAFISGRSCLEYLIERKGIKKLFVPFFLCGTVMAVCDKTGIECEEYHIDDMFLPILEREIKKNEYVYIVNYYGQLTEKSIIDLQKKYSNLILDNAQAFFMPPIKGIDTIYICRKYFGVPDGAYVYTEELPLHDYPRDKSYDRMTFLMGRFEGAASEFYEEYKKNNKYFDDKPIMKISLISENLLSGIDYEYVKKIRSQNYEYLRKYFKRINGLNVNMVEGAFAYPLLIEEGQKVRTELIKRKIYVPILWPEVLENCSPDSREYCYASDILPLPVDQRYNLDDMKYMAECIEEILGDRYQ